MRIQSTKPPASIESVFTTVVSKQAIDSLDSIESLRTSTWIVGKAKRVYRKILNFFRRILAWVFPIKRYTPISSTQIDFRREQNEDQMVYRVLVDSLPTENIILYEKKKDAVEINEIFFPDEAMQVHLRKIFGEILQEEAAKCFSTKNFGCALRLWKCSYEAKGEKIAYDPESAEETQMLLKALFNEAFEKVKQGILPDKCTGCFARISDTMEEKALFNFTILGTSKYLLLSDVLQLIDSLQKAGNFGGKMLGCTFKFRVNLK